MNFEYDFNERGLKGRLFLLAGGAGGLGRAAAALLARDGASLVIGYLANREGAEELKRDLVETYSASVEIVQGDLTDPDVREDYLETCRNMAEPLNGLVCLVGNPARVKFDKASEEDMRASMDQNYLGPVLLARSVAAEMREDGVPGSIILFSTMQAVAPFESSINYAGPKAALIQAARIMAKQWGGTNGIRVNVIAPGVNRAGMALASISSGKYDFFVNRGIIPRFGRAEDVAKLVRFLVEPDNYVTGQVITIDGGLTLRRDLG